MLLFHCTRLPKHLVPVCWILSAVRGFNQQFTKTNRCNEHCASRSQDLLGSPQSHPCLNVFFLTYSLSLLFHFCIFLSRLSELVWKLVGEISLQLALKRQPSLGPLIDGNEDNAKKSRFRPNRNSTGTIYP